MLREIANLVCTRAGFTLGTTAEFGHRKQESADRCILIAFNGGGATYFDLPDRIDQMVQILARAPKYMDAYDDSMAVFNAIHGLEVITLPVLVSGEVYEVQVIEAVNAPQYIGQDEKGRFMWSTNYIFRIHDK
jgi:hypothetical protein